MKPCPGLWETPSVNWNGDLTVCCSDCLFKLKLGNINEQSLNELWNCEKINELRIKHIKKETDDIPVCKECNGIEPFDKDKFFSDLIIWLGKVKRTDLIKNLD